MLAGPFRGAWQRVVKDPTSPILDSLPSHQTRHQHSSLVDTHRPNSTLLGDLQTQGVP